MCMQSLPGGFSGLVNTAKKLKSCGSKHLHAAMLQKESNLRDAWNESIWYSKADRPSVRGERQNVS